MKRFALIGLVPLVLVSVLFAAPPAWWSEEGTRILEEEGEENNYAPANTGQLKHLAVQASAHLDANLPGGAGSVIESLVDSFEPRSGQGYTQEQIDAFIAANYKPANLGQLKAIAKPFYDRLLAVGYDTKANLIAYGYPSNWEFDYPWDPETPVSQNYQPANLGQLKVVFSFDVTGFDSDEDGLPDNWEIEHFGNFGAGDEDDPDGDGLNNLQEYQQGSDPTDYYSQGETTITPFLGIVGGNDQLGAPEEYLADPLTVEVRSGSSTGALLANAPVTFTVTSGSGGLAETTENYPNATLSVVTGSSGVAQAWYRVGTAGTAQTVTGQTGTAASVTFQSQALGSNWLVGHWKFDEGTAQVAADSAPFAFTGTLVNDPAWDERYEGEGSLNFSGSSAHVRVESGTNAWLDFEEADFSVVAWIKTGTSVQAGRIVSKGAENANAGYFVGINAQGQLEAGLGTTQSGTSAETLHIQTTGTFSDNTWHAVAAVYDRRNSTARIYVDGTARSLAVEAGTGGTINVSDAALLEYPELENLSGSRADIPLTVSSHSGSNAFFQGGVDDVRIYRKALSAAEVQELLEKEGVLSALPQTVTLAEDTLGAISLQHQGGGGTMPVYTIVEEPENGEAELEGATVNYYPNAHFSGTDSFRFRVTKGGRAAEADVSLTVTPANDPPLVSVGGGRSVTMSGTTPATLNLSATVTDIDTDPEDIQLTWMKASGTGTVAFSGTNPLTATATFAAAGEYVLRLSANDGSSTRSDSLVVAVNASGTSALPVVSLDEPDNNVAYEFNEAIVLKVSATADAGLTVEKVEFYEGSRKIGEDTAPDGTSGLYEFNWTPSRLGVYRISAKATDSAGGATFSEAIQVRITEAGWFADPEMGAGNEGHAGSGGNGGIGSGSSTGTGGNYGPGTGGNGGGGSAGGGGDGLGNPNGADPASLDSDGDGLSNADEDFYGTNPAPGGEDTDDDGVNDGEDGWATEPLLAPERLPLSGYAVIKLPPTSEMEAKLLSDGNHVVLYDSANHLWHMWHNGEISQIAVPASYEYGPETRIRDINASGQIVGEVFDIELSTYATIEDLFVMNVSDTTAAILPRVFETNFPEYGEYGHDATINDGGNIYGYVVDAPEFGDDWKFHNSAVSYINGSPSLFGGDYGGWYHWEGEYVIEDDFYTGGPIIRPKKVNNNGIMICGYDDDYDNDYHWFNESGVGVWNGSLHKLDTTDGTNLTDINDDNHIVGYKYAEAFSKIWVYKEESWVPRELEYRVDSINNKLQGTSGNYLWQNDKRFLVEDLIGDSELTVNWVAQINNSGAMLANIDDEEVNKNALLVPVEITFEAVNDNDNVSDNKNPQTGQFMPGKGKRIFPDAKTPDDDEPRNRVRVKVNAAIPNIQVHLRALDVDDPSTDTDLDPNDQTGLESGNDNLEWDGITHTPKPPFFVANGSETIVCTTGTDGIARINGNLPQLEVTMQPGDNFRVAVALMEDGADEVAGLQVMDKNATGYVPAGDKPPTSGFNGVASPMLTTWRKLNIEVDTMEKWTGDKPSPDRVMATGISWVKNSPSGNSVLTLSGVPSVPDNFYAGGFIKSGTLQYDIISSTGNTVKIFHGSSLPSEAQYDAFIGSVELHDDDDRGAGNNMLNGSNVLEFYSHGAVINDWVKGRFAPAYIEIEEVPHTAGFNSRPTVPFELNSPLNAFTALNDHQDMRGKDREAYWYHFLVMAYQYGTSNDNDPAGEGGLDGGTTGSLLTPGISAVFVEKIRDKYNNLRDDGNYFSTISLRIDHVVAHEIPHSPGNGNDEDHSEEGLMGEDASDDDFTPKTLYRLRSTPRWQP